MSNSQFIAQLSGPLYLAIGVGGYVNRVKYLDLIKSFKASFGMQLFSGVAALLVGIMMVQFHNIWVADWRGLITIFGWIALIKGVSLFVLPAKVGQSVADAFVNRAGLINVMFGFCVAIGLLFTYYGFFA